MSGRFSDYWDDDDRWEPDPPLYPPGKLEGMTLDELKRESDRQADIQGALGDAEFIDDRAVALAEARWDAVDNEIKRRAARQTESGAAS